MIVILMGSWRSRIETRRVCKKQERKKLWSQMTSWRCGSELIRIAFCTIIYKVHNYFKQQHIETTTFLRIHLTTQPLASIQTFLLQPHCQNEETKKPGNV